MSDDGGFPDYNMRSPSPDPPNGPLLDHTAYPHVFENILKYVPFAFTKTLRATSRTYRDCVDPVIYRHAMSDILSDDQTILVTPDLDMPLMPHDPRVAYVKVLDAPKSFLAAHPKNRRHTGYKLTPSLLRFGTEGLLENTNFDVTAPTVVVFIAPQMLTASVHVMGEIQVPDDPLFPDPEAWHNHFVRAGRITPSLFGVHGVDFAATERLVFNLHVHPEHDMFGQWEIDVCASPRNTPLDVYIVATVDKTPLGDEHRAPRGSPRFPGRILNRLLLCIARQMARSLKRVRVTFVDADAWSHDWLAPTFTCKTSYFEEDEDGLDDAEDATMPERVQYWFNSAVETQYVRFWGGAGISDEEIERYTRFMSMEEFRQEIPHDDFVFDRILTPWVEEE